MQQRFPSISDLNRSSTSRLFMKPGTPVWRVAGQPCTLRLPTSPKWMPDEYSRKVESQNAERRAWREKLVEVDMHQMYPATARDFLRSSTRLGSPRRGPHRPARGVWR